MKRKLTGQQSLCAACGMAFKSVSGFDAHRAGPYTNRRCLGPAAMVEKGFEPNADMFWRIPFVPPQARKCA
jgi:hypothetical protein